MKNDNLDKKLNMIKDGLEERDQPDVVVQAVQEVITLNRGRALQEEAPDEEKET